MYCLTVPPIVMAHCPDTNILPLPPRKQKTVSVPSGQVVSKLVVMTALPPVPLNGMVMIAGEKSAEEAAVD